MKWIMNKIEQEFNELWDLLIEHDIATEDELRLITAINGQKITTLNDVLYVRTGYRDLEQFKSYELD